MGTKVRRVRILPTLHALQLGRLINMRNTDDLDVGMRMMLSRVQGFAVHVHGRDPEEAVSALGSPILPQRYLSPSSLVSATQLSLSTWRMYSQKSW